jgi:hypothetical protein
MLRLKFGLISFVMLCIGITGAFAKPMMRATLQEGVRFSQTIVVGTYQGYDFQPSVTYMEGVVARYRINEVLKGSAQLRGRIIKIRYLFHDLSPCMPAKDWSFNPKQDMPVKNTRWILFLHSNKDNTEVYDTYRGDFGRFSISRYQEVIEELQQQRN